LWAVSLLGVKEMNTKHSDKWPWYLKAIFIAGAVFIVNQGFKDTIKEKLNKPKQPVVETNTPDHNEEEHTLDKEELYKEVLGTDYARARRDRAMRELRNVDREEWDDLNERISYLMGFYRGYHKMFGWPKVVISYQKMQVDIDEYNRIARLIADRDGGEGLKDTIVQVKMYKDALEFFRSNESKIK
jgi:PHD/YefM family antitoxin component YafN of YafNO toxin-antitoxin module